MASPDPHDTTLWVNRHTLAIWHYQHWELAPALSGLREQTILWRCFLLRVVFIHIARYPLVHNFLHDIHHIGIYDNMNIQTCLDFLIACQMWYYTSRDIAPLSKIKCRDGPLPCWFRWCTERWLWMSARRHWWPRLICHDGSLHNAGDKLLIPGFFSSDLFEEFRVRIHQRRTVCSGVLTVLLELHRNDWWLINPQSTQW